MIRKKREKSLYTVATPRQQSALRLTESSRLVKRLARYIVVALMLAIVSMFFLPWQQSSRGSGQVVAYVPQERQQTVQSPAKGIVARIGEGLVEGSKVKKGDFLLEIQPQAANLVEQLRGQEQELNTKLATSNAKAEAYGENVTGFSEALEFTVQAANENVEAAEEKLHSKQDLVKGYEAKKYQAMLNYERQKQLFQEGIKPRKEIEKLKKELDVAASEFQSVKRDVSSLEKELAAKRSGLEEKRRIAQTKIDYARGMQQDALGSAATIRKEIGDLQIKLGSLDRLKITAPRDGTVFRMPVYERGQIIKEGQSLITIVPDITQKAVELYVSGNDLPLIDIGDEVRLQFEGYPAVQFAAWPSLAVGTFSGEVSTVDATDNGKGQFRILVTPLENEQLWPKERFLRQGVRANGWVMLRRVTLGYEFWRQLNGFPVFVSEKETSGNKSDKVKAPKLPK